ncbi:MAG: Type secretory pathway, VirB11 component [Dehalococcoidia bacterium]|nr:Type secretory pathway, VirB11 component [Dehalococcoidia bacterium]
MPEMVMPFAPSASPADGDHSVECGLFQLLPSPMKTAYEQNAHLLEYLHMLPIDKIGIPQFYPQISRKLQDLKERNLFYPVSDDVFIHIWSGLGEERDLYIPVEPSMGVTLNGKRTKVEEKLLGLSTVSTGAETRQEKQQAILTRLTGICEVSGIGQAKPPSRGLMNAFRGNDGGKVQVTPREFQAIRYLMLRDKAGLGILNPMICDSNIEDISCSGLGPIFLEHKIFKSLRSAATFETHEDLDQFVLRLSEQISRPVTIRNPIIDAVLPDGSRINIVFGREVSQRGSNFSIRKFADTPLSILELIEFGSLDYRMAAYLSLVLEDGMNTFVAGETASGKTTLLNAITTFLPPTSKIVSIEDTPELQVPHKNWIREISKAAKRGEQGGAEVTMFDLLKAALRQRPNVIIVGEIRGEEGATAFQAMQTGHTVMATFHASAVEKLIQRLTGNPINIPKTYIDNLNVVVIQSAVRLPNGKTARRAVSISEIIGYDPVSNIFSFVEVFRWDPIRDIFEFVGDKNSYLLEEKIAAKRGIPSDRKREIYNLLERRAKVLQKLHEKGLTNFYALLQVLSRAQHEGIF